MKIKNWHDLLCNLDIREVYFISSVRIALLNISQGDWVMVDVIGTHLRDCAHRQLYRPSYATGCLISGVALTVLRDAQPFSLLHDAIEYFGTGAYPSDRLNEGIALLATAVAGVALGCNRHKSLEQTQLALSQFKKARFAYATHGDEEGYSYADQMFGWLQENMKEVPVRHAYTDRHHLYSRLAQGNP